METLVTPRIRRWTRLEYERLIDLGAFEPGVRPLAAPTTSITVADLLP